MTLRSPPSASSYLSRKSTVLTRTFQQGVDELPSWGLQAHLLAISRTSKANKDGPSQRVNENAPTAGFLPEPAPSAGGTGGEPLASPVLTTVFQYTGLCPSVLPLQISGFAEHRQPARDLLCSSKPHWGGRPPADSSARSLIPPVAPFGPHSSLDAWAPLRST